MTDLSKMTREQLIAHVQGLEAVGNTPYFKSKVSEKGCLTVHTNGLRRCGATFYKSEWLALLNRAADIRKALETPGLKTGREAVAAAE